MLSLPVSPSKTSTLILRFARDHHATIRIFDKLQKIQHLLLADPLTGTGNGNSGGEHVPDTGSTMMLMGMALCTLGGIARRFKDV
jgi:hypothetical protein